MRTLINEPLIRRGEIDLPDEDIWTAPDRLSPDEGLSEAGADWRWVRSAEHDGEFE